jgi:7-cyano-7-deazaguanine synthase
MTMMSRVRSVVLLSGGLDSAANLALCHELDEPVLAITVRYGQKAQDKEVQAARNFCSYYDVQHQVLDLPWLGALGGSSLTESATALPQLEQNELDDRGITEKSAKSVWVPNRNGILINTAAAFAERCAAERVVVGFNIEEASTFPDNSEEFLKRSTRSLEYSTANHVQVFSYSTAWNKTRIVQELRRLKKKFPFESLWSCYLGGEKPCEHCESCQRQSRAIEGPGHG